MIDKNKKEVVCYLAVFIILLIIVIFNKTNNNYLKSGNVIYKVPYEEKVLD